MNKKTWFLGVGTMLAMLLTSCGGNAKAEGVAAAAETIAKAANRYGSSFKGEDLLNNAGVSKNAKLTNETATKLLHAAFKDTLPARTGARRVQGYDVKLADFTDVKEDASYYEALSWLVDTGLYVPAIQGKFEASSNMTNKELKLYLDRFHAYFGSSIVDDFFSTVNHDYLFEDERWKDKTDPLLDTDGDGLPDGEYVYDSNLIPQAQMNEFARRMIEKSKNGEGEPYLANFASTYYDVEEREASLAGLKTLVNNIINATSIRKLTNVLQKALNDLGFSPFWTSYEASLYTITPKLGDPYNEWITMCTSYDTSTASAKLASGQPAYNETVTNFTGTFQKSFGLTEANAAKYAKALADFRYLFASGKERIIANNPNAEKNNFYPGKNEYFGVVDSTDATGFSLYSMLKDAGISDPESWNWEKYPQIQAVLDLYNAENINSIKAFIIQQIGSRFWFCLPDEAVDDWFRVDTYGTSADDLDSVETFTDGAIPYLKTALCKYYLSSDEYTQNLVEAKTLLGQLKDSLGNRINKASWLSNKGKTATKEKLDKMGYCLGMTYGDAEGDKGTVDDLGILINPKFVSKADGGTLWSNIGVYERAKLDKFGPLTGKKYDGEYDFKAYLLLSDPMEANAFYIPSQNSIYITMGYMSSYKPLTEMTPEEKLASYGWVVGHEISHGFDANGVRYNAQGELQDDWWTASDRKAYSARTNKVISFYDGYEVMPGQKTPGSTVITEAVADITGLSISADIASKISSFDYEEFFKKGAGNFASIVTQYIYTAGELASDEHPFGRARVNRCFQTIDKFYDTFNIKEGDNMYVASKDRVTIW